MSENTRPAFSFAINWKITFASAFFLPVLFALGFWQLSRAEEKQTILDDWYVQQALPAKAVNKLADLGSGINAIRIEGHFDQARYWLFESRFYEGKLGYDVLMVMHNNAGEAILVNRGWVPASPYREELPEISTPGHEVIVSGVLKDPADFNMIDEEDKILDVWPKRILEINLDRMSKLYGVNLYPKVLRLDASSEAAFKVANNPPVNVSPAKHRAYAFQWFAMALALLILWLVANSNIVQVLKREKG